MRNSALAQNGEISLNTKPKIMSFLGIKTNKQIFKVPPGFKTHLPEVCGYGRRASPQGAVPRQAVAGTRTKPKRLTCSGARASSTWVALSTLQIQPTPACSAASRVTVREEGTELMPSPMWPQHLQTFQMILPGSKRQGPVWLGNGCAKFTARAMWGMASFSLTGPEGPRQKPALGPASGQAQA